MLALAPLESSRFGLRTLRGTIEDGLDCDALTKELIEHQADLAIIRLPAKQSHQIHGLHRFGLYPIHADTLVHYHCDLDTHELHELRNPQFKIVQASQADGDAISALIRSTFDDYANHYHANPILEQESILAGYEEWALGHLSDPNKVIWVTMAEERIIGLSCSAYDKADGTCDYVLGAVHPDFSKAGIYTDLIRYNQQYFRANGFRTLRVSTQVSNLTVQHVWAREGFKLTRALDTYHINCMFHVDPDRIRLVSNAYQAARTLSMKNAS
jgi:GNAT superfamily N-acetyltransferase